MKYKRCHVCPFNQHNNQCHYKTAQVLEKGTNYMIISAKRDCPMTEKMIEELIEAIPEPVEIPKSEIEIRRENVKQFRDQLKAIAKELNDD